MIVEAIVVDVDRGGEAFDDRLGELLAAAGQRYRIGDQLPRPAGGTVPGRDPTVYAQACARLGTNPAQCLYIGDRADGVADAAATGMPTVLCAGGPETLAAVVRALGMKLRTYRAAGGVVVDSDRDLLLVLDRPGHAEVRLPKGHVEEGETDEQAALREVAEESGYDHLEVVADLGLALVEFADFHRRSKPGTWCQREEHYFRMRLLSSRTAARPAGDEQFEARWVSAGEAVERLTYPAERAWIRRAMG